MAAAVAGAGAGGAGGGAGWADLHFDILTLVAARLDVTSLVRLSAVCTSFLLSHLPPPLPPFNLPIPWLLLSSHPHASPSNPNPTQITDFTFYHLTTASFYSIPSPVPSPSLPSGCRWLGSNSGYIAFLDLPSEHRVVSPLTGTGFQLPFVKLPIGCEGNPLRSWNTDTGALSWDSLKKVVLCRVPDHGPANGSRFLALGLFWPHGMAVLEIGARNWTWLDLERWYKDVIVYKGRIFALASRSLSRWEVRGASFVPGEVLTIGNNVFGFRHKYLVEMAGKLLVVCREKLCGKQGQAMMSVHELEFDWGGRVWNRVPGIGDHALFLGLGYSRAVSTAGLDGVRGNCIYYVNDDTLYYKFLGNPNTCHDSGIYDLGNETYEPYPVDNLPPPAWFWP